MEQSNYRRRTYTQEEDAITVEEAEHLALLNHIKYDIITVTEFLK